MIPDEGFNLLNTTSCHRPVEAMAYSTFWYSASGSADLFQSGCWDLAVGWKFWEHPPQSNYFAGIHGTFHTRGILSTEVIATPLERPMEADRYYHFKMSIRNRGIWHLNGNPIHCPETRPSKQFIIYTREQPITHEVDPQGASRIVADTLVTFSDRYIQDTLVDDEWQTYSACVSGKAEMRHLGVGFPTGKFEAPPNCPIDPGSVDFLNFFYFDLDDVMLLPFPKAQSVQLDRCPRRRAVTFDAQQLFDDPRAIPHARFRWDNGLNDPQRTFFAAGRYELFIEVACGTIPIEVVVTDRECIPNVFVANAFSPNSDGKNDLFFPSVTAEFPISDFEFTIFDRWGRQVYHTTVNEPMAGWDGRSQGVAVAEGVYVWTLRFQLRTDAQATPYTFSGNVTLLR